MFKKIFIVPILMMFLLVGVAQAQTSDLPKPGMLPDSSFYFLKSWKEGIGTFFTFGDLKKAERFLNLSEKRLAEAEALADKNKSEMAERAVERYQEQLNLALAKAEEAKAEGLDADEVLAKVSEATLKHQAVLAEVYEKVPEQAKEAIQQAMEAGMREHEEALEAVSGQKQEEIRQELEQKKQETEQRLEEIKQRIPGVAITTDIIVGFCGETEADFGKTLDLYRQAEFDLAYLAQYSVRAGTQAAKRFKDDLPKAEKRRREKILNDLVAKIALKKNEALVGKKVSVLIEANKKSFLLGKTDSSKAIRLNGGSKALVGEFVYPTVTKALAWGLEGALKKKRSLN
ncbi:hypothetical protein COY23_03590 [bacterium (Candidatus Torokbacteria) CG_4_10_14_0_2_um_filter_35_8]|nr:MAG: hypothetical protein COY23_03590 [bacterium (Candidatus Torokbacteria) CG_4_10_14_0_2_um_filter_35_8]